VTGQAGTRPVTRESRIRKQAFPKGQLQGVSGGRAAPVLSALRRKEPAGR
jgi:hypothetical protein